MVEQVLQQAASLGIAGLLFVMWWQERHERLNGAADAQAIQRESSALADVNKRLLGVVQANTEALTALRDELRAHREAEAQWLTHLARQIEGLAAE